MPTAHFDVYAKELAKYQHGHPMWAPEPDGKHGQVELGDVGHLEHGHFRFLFSSTDPKRNVLGEPEGFIKFIISENNIVEDKNEITDPSLCGESIHSFQVALDASVDGSAL